MKRPYKSQNPNAGVLNYELAPSAIILEFSASKYRYLYNEEAPGAQHVQAMKYLAEQGRGLTTYINQHVRDNYARKLPIPRRSRRS